MAFWTYKVRDLLKDLECLEETLPLVMKAARESDPKAEQITDDGKGMESLKQYRRFYMCCCDLRKHAKNILLWNVAIRFFNSEMVVVSDGFGIRMGRIGPGTIKQAYQTGANLFICGSYLQKSKDIKEAIKALEKHFV